MKKELFRYIISGILVLSAGVIYITNFPGQGEKIECVIGETQIKETEYAATKAEKPEAGEKTSETDKKAPKADEKKPEAGGKTSETDKKTPEADEKASEDKVKKDDNIQISESGRININTAGPEELMKLNGIGQVRANSIISYREENGDFEAVEDIMKVPGIKLGIYKKISEYITVD